MIFDLWDTLALWPSEAFEETKLAMSEHIDDFERVWNTTFGARQIGSIEDYFRSLGLEGDALAECLQLRLGFTRDALVPRDGAIETLDELQRRGFKRGLISVCSGDVEELWDETELAAHVDDVVLSCSVGLSKPDPRIYRLACEHLAVSPEECLFVGDGANDELAGARRVGMQPILIHKFGVDPVWPEVREWDGLRVTSIPEVLEVLERC